MLTTERHQLILEEINLRETVSLQELINLTNSSTSTIREIYLNLKKEVCSKEFMVVQLKLQSAMKSVI